MRQNLKGKRRRRSRGEQEGTAEWKVRGRGRKEGRGQRVGGDET